MKFRVAQYEKPNPYGHRFAVEIGREAKEKVWWIFFKKITVWKPLFSDRDNRDFSCASYDEAVNMIKDLKAQVPKYIYIE